MLAALQRGIPVSPRPFAELARSLGCRESELIGKIAHCRTAGMVRRFGAVFDTRRLGYRTALCCASVADPDEAAAAIVSRREVTHCYLREASGCPNLWWTWSAPADGFESSLAAIPFSHHVLPAVKRFKVDVVFGGASIQRDESTADDLPPPDETGRRIIRELQGDTEVRGDYFAGLAEKIGINEWDLLSTLEMWRRNGRLKRIGLLLDHRRSGYVANGMCCFRVKSDIVAAGRSLAASPHVTHCYERPQIAEFPYNLYAMIHCESCAEAEGRFAELAEGLGRSGTEVEDSIMLISTKEYKKTSMRFFT
jgi:DNA-binding Lrp family transcriptional regulator